MQGAAGGNRNAMQQFINVLSKDDLGLDSKNKTTRKRSIKPGNCSSVLSKKLSAKETKNVSDLDELDKHIENISNYKSPDIPAIS